MQKSTTASYQKKAFLVSAERSARFASNIYLILILIFKHIFYLEFISAFIASAERSARFASNIYLILIFIFKHIYYIVLLFYLILLHCFSGTFG